VKVVDLMNRIRLYEIALPEFQREYVWEVEQARQLLQSLYRGYPTGSLLFWETTTQPATKRAQDTPKVAGQQQIVLDGQQRLTALYLLTQDSLPPYYDLHEIKHDPRGLHFDIATGAFHLLRSGAMPSPSWVPVPECFRNNPNTLTIAQALTKTQQGPAMIALMERCVNNLSRLRGILDYDYPVQIVPISASLDDAIDVFDRVNSSGTKLTAAELALTHISGKWPEARQAMKALLHQMGSQHFHFDLDFLVRGLAGVVSGHAHFAELHYLPAETLQAGWYGLAAALTKLAALLPTEAAISSSVHLSSAEVIIPLAVYLVRQGGTFPSSQSQRRAFYWLYAANMWGRYISEVDQRLAYDISIVRRSADPWAELVEAIAEHRGRIDVRGSDLEGRGVEHPLYRMTLITLGAAGAADWITKTPLAAVPHVHSYPLFPLPVEFDTPEAQSQRKQASEIANHVFLVSEPPEPLLSLLPGLAQQQPQLLEQHCIPSDASLWRTQHIHTFLSQRRERIAAAINTRLETFRDAFGPANAFRSITDLIATGESTSLEFKSTLRFNVKTQAKDAEIEQEVVKTIAAFLNTEGGILLIGVEDNGNIYGIEHDLEYVHRKNIDGFERSLRELVHNRIGPEYNTYVRTYFPKIDGKVICALRVYRSPRPVFCTSKSSNQNALTFFARLGNLSQSLSPTEANSYIALHWRT